MLLAKYFIDFLPSKHTSLPSSLTNLPKTAIMTLMAARVGSISDNKLGGWYSYRVSKSGVIQLAKSLDIYLKQKAGDNAMCVSSHPGTVRTGLSRDYWEGDGSLEKIRRMNQGEGIFEVDRAARQLVDVVNGLGDEVGAKRGRCWDWKGDEVLP